MRTFEREVLDVGRLRRDIQSGKAPKFVKVLVAPQVLLNWIDDGIPSARIIEIRVDYDGLILDLDSDPLPVPW